MEFSLPYMIYIALHVWTYTTKQIASICNISAVDLASTCLCMQKMELKPYPEDIGLHIWQLKLENPVKRVTGSSHFNNTSSSETLQALK